MKFRWLILALFLSACGTLPQPFYGNPGPEGARLAIPPAPVLVVPTPGAALLADDSAQLYAQDLAAALVTYDVPSIARPPQKTDWVVTTTAKLQGNSVIPNYAITGPDGKSYGAVNGAPVAASDWANGTPSVLNQAAENDAGPLAKLLTNVNATIQQSNPQSLENRPPRVYFSGVTGAPGDGNNALALNLTRDLPPYGVTLVSSQTQADFSINGVVSAQPDQNSQILIELDWNIHDSNNRLIGKIVQLHDLSPADIEPYWGDVAAAAAAEAANGIHVAIVNATLHKNQFDGPK